MVSILQDLLFSQPQRVPSPPVAVAIHVSQNPYTGAGVGVGSAARIELASLVVTTLSTSLTVSPNSPE